MRIVVRGFVVLVVGLSLLGAWVEPSWAAPKTAAELQAIACGSNADKLNAARAAAGQALGEALAGLVLDAAALPTATLNALIADVNPECRAAAVDALQQRVLTEGAPFNTAKIQALVDSAKSAASFELGLVRAAVAVELVRNGFINRGAPEALRRAEAVAGGGKENILGVNLDGADAAVRAAVSRFFLTGFYRFFGGLVFGDANATCAALRTRTLGGLPAEVQTAAAAAYVSGVVIDRKETKCVAGDALVVATLKGSPAVQSAAVKAAADVLAGLTRLNANALTVLAIGSTEGRDVQGALLVCTDPNDETTCEKLTSVAFRLAAARALGLRLVTAGNVNEFVVRVLSQANQDAGLKEFPTFAVPALAYLYSN
ncbi:hypothetical protein HY009_10945 [Candidatus Acetothermia bacterium]|nr:hypothetical protein [Candidatus Acetothermia bacterium]